MTESIPERLNRELVVRLVLNGAQTIDHWTLAQTILDTLHDWDELPAADIEGRRQFLANLQPGSDDNITLAIPSRSSTTSTRAKGWTAEKVRSLGMTTDLDTAAEILGIGRTLAYELVRNDEFPVGLRRLGRPVLVSVPELLQFLGGGEASS